MTEEALVKMAGAAMKVKMANGLLPRGSMRHASISCSS
jgi:hypothetical protein